MLVYEVYDKVKDKYYVGLTKRTLKQRKIEHLREKKCNQTFHRELQLRPDDFEWNVVADNIDTVEELTKIEQEQIKLRDSFFNGYNGTLGGDWHDVPSGEDAYWSGKHWTEEEKKILSERRKGKGMGTNNAMANPENRLKVSMGLKNSEKARGKIPWNKGKKMNLTDEQRAKMSQRSREQMLKYNPMNDPEIRKKLKEALPKRKVKIIDLDLEFNSVTECAEFLNCSSGLISTQIKRDRLIKGHKIVYI